MRDWRLIILALGALTPFIIILWRARRMTASTAPQTAAPKAPRVLKPRTPDDCPLCRRAHPTPLLGNVRKPGIKPWPTRKSRRGPAKRVCTAGHACPNAACDYHGNTESIFHALVGNGRRNGVQQLKCQACQTGFSSRWGTALYRLRAPAHAVAQALLAFNLGLSAAEVQRLLGHSDTTLRLWLTRAGLHAQRVHHHFFQNLPLGHLQFDELYTTSRDKAQDLWIWVAFDPKTKLIPAIQLGPRTQAMAHAVVHAVGHVLAPGCIPVCTSDGLNLYFYALTAHFGAWCTDPTSGKTSWHMALNLLYCPTYPRTRGPLGVVAFVLPFLSPASSFTNEGGNPSRPPRAADAPRLSSLHSRYGRQIHRSCMERRRAFVFPDHGVTELTWGDIRPPHEFEDRERPDGRSRLPNGSENALARQHHLAWLNTPLA